MTVKLGKREFTQDDRDLILEHFAPAAVEVPARFGLGNVIHDWGMLGNGPDDTVRRGFAGCGDCVIAGGDHETMLFREAAGGLANVPRFTGKEAVADYSAVTGYVIGDDSTDQGTYVRDALKYRRSTGLVDADGERHTIAAYIRLRHGDADELVQAVWLGLAVGIGIQFPDTAMRQFDDGEAWDVEDGAEIIGGHYIAVTGRTAPDNIGVLTWGRRQAMTRAFYETYCDEAWAIVTPEALKPSGLSVRGFDVAGLEKALREIQ